MGRSAAVVVLVLSAAFFGAHAAEAQYFGRNKVRHDRLEFRVLHTEHFDIYYYAEEETATRHAARMAERWYTRYSRLLDHTFTKRLPLVLYASHPHFAQTNLTPGSPGEGIGGFTESVKSRIAMPFAAGLGETDHVLGHEIAHAFQIDIAKRARRDAFALPGWFIEGMAEYLSLGPRNVHTEMWIRDAAIHRRLPTLKQLEQSTYFPYRFGHAFWAYLGERSGDAVIGRIMRSKQRGVRERLREALGIDPDQLTADWHRDIQEKLRADLEDTVTRRDGQARLYVGPALSPDGRQLMFLSERDHLSLDLFMADAATGRVQKKIVSTAADPHFDSLQYIHSAGSWEPAGRRFAMTAVASGHAVLVLVDIERGVRQEIAIEQTDEIYNPSWSPDGTRIVFSALRGGLSDLFIFTLATGVLQQLTADVYADLHPAWSPDGRTIAFATDRFTSDLDDLRFGAPRIGLLTLDTGSVRPLDLEETSGKQISPQWSPDGGSLYFVGDSDGISNVFRINLASRALAQVTDVSTGVSGITATSPTLAVAARAGTLAFSVYRDGRYRIETLSAEQASTAEAPSPSATDTPHATAPLDASTLQLPADAGPTVAALLADATTGLPLTTGFSTSEYDTGLRLESIAQPYIGASTGGSLGSLVRTTFGFNFGDMLRDRQLQTMFRLGTDADDLAAQFTYMDRGGRWDWGFSGGVMPTGFYGARRAIERAGTLVTRQVGHLRYTHDWAAFAGRYNIDRARRIELGAGVRRTGVEWHTITSIIDSEADEVLSRERAETRAGRPVHLGEMRAAFVHDTSVTGPTGPVLGQRLRFEIEPSIGVLTFADVRVDARRYFMPFRPVTIAARVEHVGRYGPGAADSRLTPLVAGLHTFVRGYDLESFAVDECGRTATACSVLDELTGSRFGVINLEIRAPIPGLFKRELTYTNLPVEALAFVDAGILWTRRPGARLEEDRFRSAGAGGRVNIGGMVLEVTAARSFDRTRDGWRMSFLMRPGW